MSARISLGALLQIVGSPGRRDAGSSRSRRPASHHGRAGRRSSTSRRAQGAGRRVGGAGAAPPARARASGRPRRKGALLPPRRSHEPVEGRASMCAPVGLWKLTTIAVVSGAPRRARRRVERPAAVVLKLDRGHLCARGSRDLVQRLVSGRGDDSVVCRPARPGQGGSPLSAREDERRRPRVPGGRRDLARRSGCRPISVRVSSGSPRLRFVVGDREQLAQRTPRRRRSTGSRRRTRTRRVALRRGRICIARRSLRLMDGRAWRHHASASARSGRR
jgi:hypothetical protein